MTLPLAMQVWDIRRRACIHTYKGHTKGVTHIRFSPDGRLMASGSQDGDVRVSHIEGHRSWSVCVGWLFGFGGITQPGWGHAAPTHAHQQVPLVGTQHKGVQLSLDSACCGALPDEGSQHGAENHRQPGYLVSSFVGNASQASM